MRCGTVAVRGPLSTREYESERDAVALAPARERRRMTVLVALVEGGGPAWVERYAAIGESFGGVVAQETPWQLVVHFGYPRARESDAERAVRAGLAIIAHRGDPDEPLADRPPAVRLAAGRGYAVVPVPDWDAPPEPEPLGVGALAGILLEAAEAAAEAAPGSLVVSDGVLDALADGAVTVGEPDGRGWVRVARLEPPAWPTGPARHGVPGLREVLAPERPTAGSHVAPLIGRQRQLERLQLALAATSEGEGHAVLVTGEPGIGKSRLVEALRSLSARTDFWMTAHCSELASSTPLQPFIGMFARAAGINREMSRQEQLGRIRRALAAAGPVGPIETAVRLVAALFSIEPGHDLADPPGSPEEVRHETLELLVNWTVGFTRQTTTILLVEDLHWADPSSLELIHRLRRRISGTRMLLLMTSRSIDAPDPQVEVLVLDRLGAGDSSLLAAELARAHGLDGLSAEVLPSIVERAEGVPLFVEELVQLASRARAGTGMLPPTLETLLLARLDQAGPAKRLAQIASAIGRSFSLPLLAAVSGVARDELVAALAMLHDAGLVGPVESQDVPSYAFCHALIRDAAYASLPHRERRRVHAAVAEVLERRFARRVEAEPELLAHHIAESGQPLRAARVFERAGRMAARRAALAEAVANFRRGLGWLEAVPAGLPIEAVEMRLLVLLGAATAGVEGPGYPALLGIGSRAVEAATAAGDDIELSAALHGLATYHYHQGNFERALEICDQMAGIARWTGSRIPQLRAEVARGAALAMSGNLRAATQHLAAACEMYRVGDFEHVSAAIGPDIGVTALTHRALVSFVEGRADQAVREAEVAVDLAEALPSGLTRAEARSMLVRLRYLRGDHTLAHKLAEESVQIDEELGFPYWQGVDQLVLGAEMARAGEDGALEVLAAAQDLLAGGGGASWRPLATLLVADAHLSLGDPRAAAETVELGIRGGDTHRQPLLATELYRVHAIAVAASGEPGAADGAVIELRRALGRARRQGAIGHELRVAVALAELLSEQGKQSQAVSELAASIDRLPESNETADQRVARGLLDSLQSCVPADQGDDGDDSLGHAMHVPAPAEESRPRPRRWRL